MHKNRKPQKGKRPPNIPGDPPKSPGGPEAGQAKSSLPWLIAAGAALLVGTGARLWYYCLNDSLWRDESKLLLNIAHKSFAALLGPLEYEQEAPIPLLWLYRLFYLAGGGGELPLRAVSLIASILTLILFFFLVKRVLTDRRAGLFSIWLLALAPGVILFAAMAKHYAWDILVATVLLWLAAPVLISADKPSSLTRLTCAAALVPWVSYPGIFVLGGIGAGLILRYRILGLLPVAKFLVVTALSVSLEIFMVLDRLLLPERMGITNKIVAAFNIIHNVQDWWLWLFCQIFYAYLGPQKISMGCFEYPYGYYFDPFVLVVAGLGTLGLWECRRQSGWAWTAALIGPLLLALAAYCFRFYWPFGRLLLFATPGLYLLAGYGAAWLFRKVPWPRLVGLILVILVIPSGKYAWEAFGRPLGGVREGLKYIAAHQQSGDLVFFDTYAAPTIAYYRLLGRPYAVNLHYGLHPEEWIEGKVDDGKLEAEDVLPFIPPGRRIWLVSETIDYVRGPVTDVPQYLEDIVVSLDAHRTPISSYITDRVRVIGFYPRP